MRCWEVLKPHAHCCERIACVRGQRARVKNAAMSDPTVRWVTQGLHAVTWTNVGEGTLRPPPGGIGGYAASFSSSLRLAAPLGLATNSTDQATKSVVNTRSPFFM